MRTFTPEDYVPIFKQFGVTLVIRLNKKTYEANRFTKNGIKHEEIYFLDGSTPTDDKVLRFLELCEKEKGCVSVHCKVALPIFLIPVHLLGWAGKNRNAHRVLRDQAL